MPTEALRTATLILRGHDPARPAISYVELLRHAHLKRVRDVSHYVRPAAGQGEFVLAVQLRDTSWNVTTRTDVARAVQYLMELMLLSPSAVVTDHALHIYSCDTITNAGMQQIEQRSGGCISGLRTTDFADEFG